MPPETEEKIRLSAATRLGPGGYHIHQRTFSPGESCPSHRHEFCEFFLVTEGELIQVFNGVEKTLPSGTLQFCFANDEHKIGCCGSSPAKIFNVHIGNLRLRNDLAALSDKWRIPIEDCIQRISPLPQPAFHSLLYKLELLWKMNADSSMAQVLFRLLTEEVLFLLASHSNAIESSPNPPEWLLNTYQEMQKPENFTAGFARMVELSGKSQEHLCRTFRSYYGLTPREFILELKLLEAAQLLAMGVSVTEAASRSGFRNLSYFRTAFLARYAMLPLQYRKKFCVC